MPTRIAPRRLALAVPVAVVSCLGLAIASAAPASAALDKKITSSQLKTLENNISKGKHLTYSATYTALEGGKSSTVTIAQSPPKSAFITSGGDVVDTGSKTYYCS